VDGGNTGEERLLLFALELGVALRGINSGDDRRANHAFTRISEPAHSCSCLELFLAKVEPEMSMWGWCDI
jgi:hypothetical protein